MNGFILTCECHEPTFKEEIKVKANNFEQAQDKAKSKVAKKYRTNKNNINIVAVSICRFYN